MSKLDLYRQHCASLGLDHKGVARLFGVGLRTPYRWHDGDTVIPDYVFLLFGVMLHYSLTVERVHKLAKLQVLP